MANKIGVKKKLKIFWKYGGHCAYCGKKLDISADPFDHDELIIDHLIPRIDGGTNDIDNLMPSCRVCNLRKKNKSLRNFRMRLEQKITNLLQDTIQIIINEPSLCIDRQFVIEKLEEIIEGIELVYGNPFFFEKYKEEK